MSIGTVTNVAPVALQRLPECIGGVFRRRSGQGPQD